MIHNTEGDRGGGAILVAHDFLGVEVVNPLIPAYITAEGEAAAKSLEGILDALSQGAGEDGGFCRSVVGKHAGFGAEFCDPTVIDDDHSLTVGNGNGRTVGDDIFRTLGVGGTSAGAFLGFGHQNVLGKGITIKILFPLVSQHTAGCTKGSFDKTHM